METLQINSVGKVRKARQDGRDYLVAPMVMIRPGVLSGSKGSLLYQESDIAENHSQWDKIPVVVDHPFDAQGNSISAKSPGVLDKQGIGHVFKSRIHNGSLKAEAWIDIQKANKVDSSIVSSLKSGRPMEISTGLYTQNSPAPPNSVHNGRAYQFIATQYVADHLAVLRGQNGACSVSDGCGLNVNQLVANARAVYENLTENEKSVWDRIANYNPNHDTKGQFSSDDSAGSDKDWNNRTVSERSSTLSSAAKDASTRANSDKSYKASKSHVDAANTHSLAATVHHTASQSTSGAAREHHLAKVNEHLLAAGKHFATAEKLRNPGPTPGFSDYHKLAGNQNMSVWEKLANNSITKGHGYEKPPQVDAKEEEDAKDNNEDEEQAKGTEPGAGAKAKPYVDTDPNYQQVGNDDGEEMTDNFKKLTANAYENAVAVYNRDWPAAKRDKLSNKDFAGPNQSFPIQDQTDVDSAAKLIGHAQDPAGVKSRIVSIAKRKGLNIPDAWKETTNACGPNCNCASCKAKKLADNAGGDSTQTAPAVKAPGASVPDPDAAEPKSSMPPSIIPPTKGIAPPTAGAPPGGKPGAAPTAPPPIPDETVKPALKTTDKNKDVALNTQTVWDKLSGNQVADVTANEFVDDDQRRAFFGHLAARAEQSDKAKGLSTKAKASGSPTMHKRAANAHREAQKNYEKGSKEYRSHGRSAAFHASQLSTNSRGDEAMAGKLTLTANDRSEIMDALVTNCACQETERATLNALSDETLITLTTNAMPPALAKALAAKQGKKGGGKPSMDDQDEDDDKGEEYEDEDMRDNMGPSNFTGSGDNSGENENTEIGSTDDRKNYPKGKTTHNRQMSVNEFMAMAPPEVQSMVRNAARLDAQEKQKLIHVIVSNANNPYSEQRLNKMKTEDLRPLAKLAGVSRQRAPMFQQQAEEPVANYYGAASPDLIDNSAGEIDNDFLPLPTVNFEDTGAKKAHA